MNMIKTTIGRQVWFRGIPWAYFDPAQLPGSISKTPLRLDANQPMAATIVYVHNDRCVNLDVIDHAGVHWPLHSVTLKQDGQEMNSGTCYAEWMPYQLGQAKPETPHANFDSLARGADWPNLPNISTQASEVLSGTGQLSTRSA